VRETLFNWLGQDLSELTTLDLFAGSAALSFESLSRGAARAVAVDASADAVAAMRQNAALLGAENLEPHRGDAIRWLATEARRFDVVFVDPPFSEDWLPRLWPLLPLRLNAGSWVYVEQPRQVRPPAGWTVHRHQSAGGVHYHLLRFETAADQPVATDP
jgi:16S rRNA (guanine966-N2)-methyltransferase